MLGAHKDYLKRGLICELQGYGIGAFAYYRRIVEAVIDKLLDSIPALLSGAELEAYRAALTKTKDTRVTQEKIELVKDMLPAILRPNDTNPLKALHGILSEGLHAQSDEECLKSAVVVRTTLVFLASQVAASAEAGREFSESMKVLLARKTKASDAPPIKKGA